MIVVYWLLGPEVAGAEQRAQCAIFEPDRLADAMRCAEALRARRRAGEAISHVAIQSELPESVGAAGVADPPKDYAHYKRRIDPALPLGRKSGS